MNKLLIPTEKQQKPGGIFESEPYEDDFLEHSSGLVTIENNSKKFHLYPILKKYEEKYYLIIESLEKTNYTKPKLVFGF